MGGVGERITKKSGLIEIEIEITLLVFVRVKKKLESGKGRRELFENYQNEDGKYFFLTKIFDHLCTIIKMDERSTRRLRKILGISR